LAARLVHLFAEKSVQNLETAIWGSICIEDPSSFVINVEDSCTVNAKKTIVKL
jgi:hypothetical protein